MESGKEEKPRYLCPRCGKRGYLEFRRSASGQVYVYMHHQKSVGGKRTHTSCYLGSEAYKYVEKFNELALRGLHDRERFYEYALRVIDQLTVDQLERLREHINRRLGA